MCAFKRARHVLPLEVKRMATACLDGEVAPIVQTAEEMLIGEGSNLMDCFVPSPPANGNVKEANAQVCMSMACSLAARPPLPRS